MDSAGFGKGIMIENPGRPTPGVVRVVRRFLDPVVRLCHRPTLEGVENLPPEGPFLLVANHSGGMGIAEILSFAVMYLREVGPERPLAGFALPVGFHVFPLSAVHRAVGTIPSTYEAAAHAISLGVPILVFPGGDHESLKPIWQLHRVDLAGRLGFLRIAREHGVPIVPLGIRGGHMTAPVLFRSKALATLLVLPRVLGVKRWGLSLLGVLVSILIGVALPAAWYVRAALVWLWLGSPFVFLPWIPWSIRMRIGAPLHAGALFPGSDTDASLRDALARVESSIQRLVDR